MPGILSASPTRACRLLLMGCAPTSGRVSVLGGPERCWRGRSTTVAVVAVIVPRLVGVVIS